MAVKKSTPVDRAALKPKGKMRGAGPCPACGKSILPQRRRVPHPDTPECLVIRTQAAYKARGWMPLSEALGATLRDAGIPVEYAPGATHLEPRLIPREQGTSLEAQGQPKNLVRHDEVVHDVPFAPVAVARLVKALAKTPRDFRLRAVRALWQEEDIGEAIDAIQRLGGRVTGFVHRLVLAAEAKTEAAAQGPSRTDATASTHD